MSGIQFGIRTLMRDLRAGELTVLLVAIVVAVSAMTAVGFFTDRVGRVIRQQASAVLAADLELRSASPIDLAYLQDAQSRGLATAEAVVFPTMVLAGERNSLATVRAVSEGYPLRGEILVADEMYGESRRADSVPASGTAWAEPGLLGRLGAEVGVRLTIGESSVQVTQVLEYQPGQSIGGMGAVGPGLVVNLADLPAFDVVKPGSRVTYRQLFAGPESAIANWRAALKPRMDESLQLRGLEDAGEQINAAIDRAQRFLTLASLVTVILAAVATAMAARRYALRHLDSIALMKTIGATQGFVQRSMLAQLGIVILVTAAAGTLLGYVAQGVLVSLAADFVNVELPAAAPTAGLLGLLTAATITLGFALPHLLQLKTTPPMRVLRHDLPPPQLGAGLTYGIAVGALFVMVWIVVRDLLLVILIGGGLMAVAGLSVLAGWVLVRGLARFRGAAGVAWRYGLANISRRGAESVVQIVAFALSLMVLLLLTVVRTDLLDDWQRSLPDNAPNYFLINIEPEEWPAVESYFSAETGQAPSALPFLRGRISQIKGQPVADYEFPEARGRNFIRQESNLTWGAELPSSNSLRAGRWWTDQDGAAIQASLEAGLAASLGVELGDMIGFNVGGEEFEAPVTSLRFVEWDSLQPNFYIMLSPGLAAELPQTYIASLFVPPEKRRILSTFIRNHPSVTIFDLDVILGQVRTVIERASMAVQYVFLFTLLAGVMVLLAAIQVTRDERRFESAILHALGAGRRTILQGVAVEFVTLGLLAGLLAAIGASLVGWVLAEQVFDLDYSVSPLLWLAGCLAGCAIVGVTGTLAMRRAVNEPPVAVLRDA